METIKLDVEYQVCFGDDLDVEYYMFIGQEGPPVYKGHFSIEEMVKEFIAIRMDFKSGKISPEFVGDTDCLALRLRQAADLLEQAVEDAYAD